jgi:hypothetical protein
MAIQGKTSNETLPLDIATISGHLNNNNTCPRVNQIILGVIDADVANRGRRIGFYRLGRHGIGGKMRPNVISDMIKICETVDIIKATCPVSDHNCFVAVRLLTNESMTIHTVLVAMG